jgi:hypothetical protein
MASTAFGGMRAVYLGLAIAGYLLPGVPTLLESVQTGNILFLTDPARTTAELFANRTSTAFALDLFGVVLVAFVWMAREARRLAMRHVWRYWVAALIFGIAGTLALFLYVREGRLPERG